MGAMGKYLAFVCVVVVMNAIGMVPMIGSVSFTVSLSISI